MTANESRTSSDGEMDERRNGKRAVRRNRWGMGADDVASKGKPPMRDGSGDVASNVRQPMPDGSDMLFRKLVRTLKRVGRKNRRASDVSSSDDEDEKQHGWSLLGLLRHYELHMVSAEHLPEEKSCSRD